ncbi:MAG: rhomboid family intramembrane serine protease [Deltaproteobacteria bacterium]|nr:rhomboid family intramembrane serine protease [Deltaproteobacteria bacterium]
MSENQYSAILCPNCRKLISSDETRCPHCGMHSPGAKWKGYVAKISSGDIITYIIYTNIIFYVVSILFNPGGIGLGGNPLSFLSPSDRSMLLLGATGTVPIDKLGRWWTLISANYLHGGLLHIFFNMMALRQVGRLIVREYGPNRMLIIYTLGGAGGFLISYVAGIRFTIGASAAVCALIGAGLYYGKSRGGNYGQAVYKELFSWVIVLGLFGFIVPGINNWGHGGGMVSGALIASVLGYRDKSRDNYLHLILAASCIMATFLILIWAPISVIFRLY